MENQRGKCKATANSPSATSQRPGQLTYVSDAVQLGINWRSPELGTISVFRCDGRPLCVQQRTQCHLSERNSTRAFGCFERRNGREPSCQRRRSTSANRAEPMLTIRRTSELRESTRVKFGLEAAAVRLFSCCPEPLRFRHENGRRQVGGDIHGRSAHVEDAVHSEHDRDRARRAHPPVPE